MTSEPLFNYYVTVLDLPYANYRSNIALDMMNRGLVIWNSGIEDLRVRLAAPIRLRASTVGKEHTARLLLGFPV